MLLVKNCQQALILHHLGRSWRKPLQKLLDHGWVLMPYAEPGKPLLVLTKSKLNMTDVKKACPWFYILFQVIKMGNKVELQVSVLKLLQDSAVDIRRDDSEADCTSYHCRCVGCSKNHLAGFIHFDLLNNAGDFEDFCSRASQLADSSNGAPLFTVVRNLQPAKPIPCHVRTHHTRGIGDTSVENLSDIGDQVHEDEWQIL
ncbi:hypothetical protein BHE74_00047313 [Ensete ventricosum]|nr:hypothetical protein GW17_00008185 [Ensete ventricosum]RWW46735.1 hypothetical protein BHE74_00047313 [Ensete ventricosum]RZR99969.1 hypothetical protein BHM03_00029604 [Ensete ventricosum]